MVFPDWSPYPDLDSAARAYLRDPDLALEALTGVLGGADVLCFTLERFVNEVNGVWQEVAVCDGTRLVLWHGEDVAPGEGPAGSMTSSVRVVPLSRGERGRHPAPAAAPRRRRPCGSTRSTCTCCSARSTTAPPAGPDDPPLRQDALRFVKTLEEGGKGQIARLEEFARTVASLVGRPL